jgi:hypothetical protein
MVTDLRILSHKKITRREFIIYAGLVFLTITGITPLLKSLSLIHPGSHPQKVRKPQVKTAYGSRPYGV